MTDASRELSPDVAEHDPGAGILFDDPKRVAIMMRSYLMQQLHELQGVIIRCERFGENVVMYPSLARLGSSRDLPELIRRADERAEQINALNVAIDKASEAEIFAYVSELNRRNKAEREAKARKK